MNVYVTRRGVNIPRLAAMLVVAFLAALLIVTVLPSGGFAEDAPTSENIEKPDLPKGSDSDGDGDFDRPDAVSAAVTARLVKKRVEDLSKRTGSTRTFVNPDGTLTDEQFGDAVRVQGEDGLWEDVDYNLEEKADGSYAPKVSPVDVTIHGGSTKEAARVTFDDGQSLAVTWPENLPEPTIEGGVATYKVSDATDLLIVVTSMGVNARIRLNEQPASDDPAFTLGLRAEGVDVTESAGGLKLVDESGDKVGGTSNLIAWDAKTDDAGSPAETVSLDANLDEVSSHGDVTQHSLELTTPAGFLSDPDTEYPVIIDPDISGLSHVRDTWLRSGDTVTRNSDYNLISGKISSSSNTNPAQAFIQFNNVQIAGKTILKAELGLYQYYAYTCSDRRMLAYPISEAWTAGITWPNRPTVTTSYSTYVDVQRGATGCSRNTIKVDVTAMTKAWASGALANNGLRLNAADSLNGTYERRFCSFTIDTSTVACASADHTPNISVTYNGPPNQAAVPSSTASRTWNGSLYVTSTKPTWSSSATDAEASQVKYTTEARPSTTSTTVSATCTTALVSSGAAASCASTTSLVNGTTYWARSMATDSLGAVGPWSGWRQFTVDTTTPTVPTVACSGFADGQWYDTAPVSSTTCTFAASGAEIDWKVNTVVKSPLPLSGGSAAGPAIAVPATGYTRVEARSRTRSGLVSAWKSFSFGTGGAVLTEPIKDDRSTSTFPLNAAAPLGAESAKIQWRFAPTTEGDTTTGWADATEVKQASDGTSWSGSVTGTDMSKTPRLIWDPRAETGISAPALVEVRVAFSYPGSVTKVSPLQRVQVVPHAFGGSFPTEDFGPGQVALFTGEFQLSETDVDVPGFGGSLTLGRSHLTLAGEPAGPAGVFGPGWVADLSGPEEGAAGFTVLDRTAADGSIVLMDPEGDSDVYRHSSNTKGAQKAGSYKGVGETALDEAELTLVAVTGEPGLTHRMTLADWDGTRTIFVRTDAGVWTTEKVVSPEDHSTTTYAHNTDGTVSWIFAPAPSGVGCDTTSQQPGCRALQLVYTGTGADKRVSEVRLRIWDPKPAADGTPGTDAAMETITIAKYTYNASGQLSAAWDPRVADGTAALKTEYEYDVIADKVKITKVTEPGLKPWRFEYTGGGKIKHILRSQDSTVGSGDAVWTVKYDLNLATSGDGLPDLSSDATATWGQVGAPVDGTAVFGPDHIPGTGGSNGGPSADDYEYADLSYFTQSGRTTNTAAFGADEWQIDSTRYDNLGNEVWSLSAEGRENALAEGSTVEETAGAADRYATITVYNAAGTRVEETYDPMRELVLNDGTAMVARTVTQTAYDDEADAALMPGRPTTDVPAEGFGLAVEERSSVTDRITPGAAGDLFDTKTTRYRYDPVSSGDGDGWEMMTPTRVLTEDESGWSTTLTRFDIEGKVVETRTPQGTETVNGLGSDTRSTKIVYYTADTSASRSECRSKPAWAGEVCWTGQAGQPDSGQPIPATTTTGYSVMLAPTRVEETSGSVTRVSIYAYDPVGRASGYSSTTSGLTVADRAIPTATATYSPTTGAMTSSSNGDQTRTSSYDSWGRITSQTDGTGNTATTTYDTAGRVATANDGKGTYTYTYNGTDSRGKKERRGLVTSLDVGLSVGPDVFTGSYDAAGALVEQNYPGGITATRTLDSSGTATGLAYTKDGEPLLGYSATVDTDGRVRQAASTGSSQTYTYDARDRLKRVTDTAGDQCTTRAYGFNGDSNRTSLATYDAGTDGACQSTTAASTVSSSFDVADRITTSGYTYDELGRSKTVPATDTSNPSGGALSVGYAANDMVATLSQSVVQDGATVVTGQDFTLDVAGRLSVTKSLVSGVSLVESTDHYSGSGDAPSWTQTKTRPDAATAWDTTWNRNIAALSGDLGIIVESDGTARLQLGNLHGDITSTVTIGDTGLDSYSEYTEYGLPRDDANTPERYGWLGARLRDAGTVGGLTLMGARVYNPTTGRFLSRDPIPGGTDNTYVYPADPVNGTDLSGCKTDGGPKGNHSKCKQTGINKVWLPYKASKIAWGDWVRKAPGAEGKSLINWAKRQFWNTVSFVTRVSRVDFKTHKGTRKVEMRRCMKNGYWQYRTDTLKLSQSKAKFRVTVIGPLDFEDWVTGGISTTSKSKGSTRW